MESKESAEKPNYSIAVLGGGGVGKSALTIRFVTDNWVAAYDPTLEAKYKKTCFLDGEESVLDILDTAGQDEYLQMLDQWIRECSGYILVYAVDDETSFTRLTKIREKILRVREGHQGPIPIVLVGNKCDLEEPRRVKRDEGQARADEWGATFMETSAKNKVNLDQCFHAAARAIRDARNAPAAAPTAGNGCKCIIM